MLTEAQIKAIQPDGRTRYIADGRSGLRLRVYPSGKKRWVVRSEVGGRTRERLLGEWPLIPVAEARRRAATAPKVTAAPMTFEAAARLWHAERIIPRYRSSAPVVWRIFERDAATLMSRRVDSISRAQLLAIVEKKKLDGHNAAGKLLRLLRKCYRYLAAHELIATNPLAEITPADMEIKTADPRDRLATDAELRAVWNTLLTPHRELMRFTLLTACRVGEARGAEADQVVGDVWTIPMTKNGKSHSLPLSKTARALIAKGWELRSPEGLYQALNKVAPGLKPHDLRRTAATRMRELGISSDVIDRILNHSEPRLKRTYQRPDLMPEMREAMAKWERALLRVVR